MANFSTILQTSVAFFHSKSKTLTESTQNVYESLYKSAHSTRRGVVWADEINYCVDAASADYEAIENDAVTKYITVPLTQIGGSNGQAWYLDIGGVFTRPWIAPTDIPHETTSEPSYGFQANLYTQGGILITPTQGRFVFDYYAGIVQFEAGYTPADMGWGIPKIVCYVYTGDYLTDGGGGGEGAVQSGIGKPFDVAPITDNALYIDIATPFNPKRFILWGWSNLVVTNPGWRPFRGTKYHAYDEDEGDSVQYDVETINAIDTIFISPGRVYADVLGVTDNYSADVDKFLSDDLQVVGVYDLVRGLVEHYELATVFIQDIISYRVISAETSVLNEGLLNTFTLNS